MKPARLKLLIVLFYVTGVLVGIIGFLSTESFGLWLALVLMSFFTAHLLSIPHNSGRHWAHFIAFGLFSYSAVRLIVLLDLTDNSASEDFSLLEALGIPIFPFLLGLVIFLLSFHSSVCDFFDSLDLETSSSDETKTKNA